MLSFIALGLHYISLMVLFPLCIQGFSYLYLNCKLCFTNSSFSVSSALLLLGKLLWVSWVTQRSVRNVAGQHLHILSLSLFFLCFLHWQYDSLPPIVFWFPQPERLQLFHQCCCWQWTAMWDAVSHRLNGQLTSYCLPSLSLYYSPESACFC